MSGGDKPDVVGELALQEVGGVLARDRDQAQVAEITEGEGGVGRGLGKPGLAQVIDSGRAGPQKFSPLFVHRHGVSVSRVSGAGRNRYIIAKCKIFQSNRDGNPN